MRYGYEWRPYVPVGQKKGNARKFADKLAKKQKRERRPIEIEGRKIARTFWGKAWCDHLESLSDYSNRLPRGGTYVRNGSVVDLVIKPGIVNAIVAGSEPYEVSISIKKLDKKTWSQIKKDCSSSIDSLIDLLGGRLSDAVMHRLTDKKSGCFPSARQIEMDCDCPDWSRCCKHIAAVMYAIGSRLDSEPVLLFLLRGVNQEELISHAVSKENLARELTAGSSDLVDEDLGAIFGIELDSSPNEKVAEAKVAAKCSKVKTTSRTANRGRKGVAKKKSVTVATSTKRKTGVKKKSVAVKKATRKKVAKKRTATKKKAVKTVGTTKNSGRTKTKVPAKKSVSRKKKTSALRSRAMKTVGKSNSEKSSS